MESNPVRAFLLGVFAVFFLAYVLGLSVKVAAACLAILVIALVIGPWLLSRRKSTRGIFRVLGGSEFLCDDCKYNYGNVCVRPERPNATDCPDYKPK